LDEQEDFHEKYYEVEGGHTMRPWGLDLPGGELTSVPTGPIVRADLGEWRGW